MIPITPPVREVSSWLAFRRQLLEGVPTTFEGILQEAADLGVNRLLQSERPTPRRGSTDVG